MTLKRVVEIAAPRFGLERRVDHARAPAVTTTAAGSTTAATAATAATRRADFLRGFGRLFGLLRHVLLDLRRERTLPRLGEKFQLLAGRQIAWGAAMGVVSAEYGLLVRPREA